MKPMISGDANELATGPALSRERLQLVPGRRQLLSDQVYGQILEQIVSGRLATGARLPTEVELCESFAVSRPVVREALSRLRSDGLLQSRQGAGTYVLARPAERLTHFAQTEDIANLLRCIEVRLPIEGTAAKLAAERRTPEALQRIEAALAAFVNETEAGGATPECDFGFHASIAAASENMMFLGLLEQIHALLLAFMRLSLNLTRTGSRQRAAQVIHEHRQIVDAIRTQDRDAAYVAMQFHISQARRRMVDGSRDV